MDSKKIKKNYHKTVTAKGGKRAVSPDEHQLKVENTGRTFIQKDNLYGTKKGIDQSTAQKVPKQPASGLEHSSIKSISFDWNDDSRGYELVAVIRNGIDYKTFKTIANESPFNDKDWAVILDTTTRTLDRYKKDNKTFAPKITETIIEVQQLMKYGEDVFGDIDNFHSWLMMENVAMGGVVPKHLLDTSIGVGMVKDFLGRIEHGILA